MLVDLAQRIKSGQHQQQNLFDSIVGQMKTLEKRWIVDIDTKDEFIINGIKACIEHECKPISTFFTEPKIEATIPTKNGVHLITKKFDVIEFKKQYPDVDIQKKNPTLLYYPDSLKS